MLTDDLYSPHVTVIHDTNNVHHFSVLMVVPENTEILYRDFQGAQPPRLGAKLEMEFSFDSNNRAGWFDLPNPQREPVQIGGKSYHLVSFFIQITDLKTAQLHTKIEHHPHKKKEGVLLHNGMVHLPGEGN